MTPGTFFVFVGAMLASLLPSRLWPRLPSGFPMQSAAFASGFITLLIGAAIGIPGFLEHAHATSSLGIDAQLGKVFGDPGAGYSQGMSQGFAGLSLFTFLLLTPQGWVTLYLIGSGGVRMAAAWFDDPVGDPILTGADAVLFRLRTGQRTRAVIAARAKRSKARRFPIAQSQQRRRALPAATS